MLKAEGTARAVYVVKGSVTWPLFSDLLHSFTAYSATLGCHHSRSGPLSGLPHLGHGPAIGQAVPKGNVPRHNTSY
jgi:hypothetical protein